MTNTEKINRLFEIMNERDAYMRTLGKLSFDMQCTAPEEGMERAGEDMAVLGQQLYKIVHSEEYERLIVELHENDDGLTDLQKKVIEHAYDAYSKTKNITPEFAYEMDMVSNQAYAKWLEAKSKNDFSIFRDSFEKIIENTRKSIDLREEKKATYYDSCLDDFEKGGNQQQLDKFFDSLKERIVPLMNKIVKEGKPIREDFLTRLCPIPQQEEFSKYLMEAEGLRKTATVLMTSEHPFTTNFGPKDVRITTHYFEDNFISNIFSTMHEGGHALFMQNEPDEFYAQHADNAMSNAMHECISRFYENIIGRSEAFIHFIYPELQRISGDIFSDVSERELYEAVNIARPSLIRTEADELTYCLHILVRYELEKAFINGEITVDEVPALWNKKYKEYLGIDVPSDSEGCLQDVHWASSYGYFPSYALGNAYGVQILRTMEKEFDVFGEVRNGNLIKILDWLKNHVFNCASVMDPDEWINHITGESLNVDYYLDYLEEKYSTLYGLK